MEIAYNLKYQKSSFRGRMLLEKEGEIIIYAKGFRLRGKGAGDKGEVVNFSEIKEFYFRNEKVIFVTFLKEKFVLSDVGTQFDQLIADLFKARNEFLADALFMKKGKMRAEFEASFERTSKFGRQINKGMGAKVRLYEGSLVILPHLQDAFSVDFNFIAFQEFDDMEYKVKMVMDNGTTLFLTQLGDYFELFEEKFEQCLAEMYQFVIEKVLREVFPHYNAATLLKLAYRMKGGKAVSVHDMKDADKELAGAVSSFVLENEDFRAKMITLLARCDEYNSLYGVAADKVNKGGFVRYLLLAVPEKNAVIFSLAPRWEGEVVEAYFYRVVMEKGSVVEKLEDKLKEVDNALLSLDFVKDPCFKDKRELKHSPYLYAIRKMPFLRILRKSYVGKVNAGTPEVFAAEIEGMLDRCAEVL
ncbi:hypothetical protein KA119_01120 [Candidatus Gracilibacteria bacterium]|nr:hypothetical protein [Candidatus Gracilibacteria bacterium]